MERFFFAFCIAAGEPILVSGPTCFKSHCVRLLGESLDLEQPRVNTLYLSRLSEAADLHGGVEPHSLDSFAQYLRTSCLPLLGESSVGSGSTADEVPRLEAILEGHAAAENSLEGHRRSNARWCGMLLRELRAFKRAPQGFPWCERGVLPP